MNARFLVVLAIGVSLVVFSIGCEEAGKAVLEVGEVAGSGVVDSETGTWMRVNITRIGGINVWWLLVLYFPALAFLSRG